MFKNEDDLKEAVSQLNIDYNPNPSHRERLREQMLSVFEKTGEQSIGQARTLWRAIMKSPITKLTAAAVIIIAAFIVIQHFTGSIDGATVAFAQMTEAIKKTPWMHVVEKIQSDEKEWQRQQEFWYSFKSQIKIVKTPDGIWYRDYGKGKLHHYDPKSNTITIKPLSIDRYLVESPEQFLQKEAELILEFPQAKISKRFSEYKGRKVEILEYTFTHRESGKYGTPSKHREVRGKIVANLKTHLPIFCEYESLRVEDKNIRKSHSIYEYPKMGPRDIYTLGVLQTAKVIDETDVYVAKGNDGPTLVSTPKPTTGPEMAALDIKLPRPMFVGTPQDIKVANLEKPLGKPRSPFYAPVGTKNVALGKKVTSTDEMPIIGEIEMITDGDKEGSDGSYVEMGPFKQHVTINLGAEHDIYVIVVWHFHKQPRVYFDVVVQVAIEPNFVKPVTLFNNDIDNSLKFGVGKNMHYVETSEGKLIDAKGTRGRYVRLYSQGNTHDDLNHYIEVEVYGKAATDKPESATDQKKDQIKNDKGDTEKADPNTPKTEMAPLQIKLPTPLFIGTPQNVRVPYLKKPLGKPRPPFYAPVGTKNVALGKPVTCTDEEPIIGETDMITDGDKEGSDGSFIELGPLPQSITIDLEAVYDIYAIVVWHYHKEAWVFFDVVVQVADDPDFITNVRTLFNNDIDNSLGLGVGKNMHYTETAEGKLIDAKGVRARYVRLHSNGSTGSDANHYIEVEVYGKAVK
jgi:hypothetical protein